MSSASRARPPGRSLIVTREAREPPVGDEPDLDDAAQHRRVDVAAGEHQHDAFPVQRVEPAGDERGERRRARAFDDALLELGQAQDRERDRRLVDGDDAVDDALRDLERRGADLRDREAVGQRRAEGHRRRRAKASAAVRQAAASGSTPIDLDREAPSP